MTDLDFDRDRWGRPLIPVDGGMKPKPYTRPSSLGKALTDDTALNKWMLRQVVWGMSTSRPLQQLATAVKSPQEVATLNDIASRALEAAGSSDAASYGTSVHACVQTMLECGDIDRFDDEVKRYANVALTLLLAAGFTPMLSEQAVVNDEIEAAGTFDLLAHDAEYQPYVFDLKTSKSSAPQYSSLSWAVQLATYAYAESLFDLETKERHEWEAPPSLTRAYVLHVPSDNLDKAKIIPLDIEAGYWAAKLATRVRNARKHKFIVA